MNAAGVVLLLLLGAGARNGEAQAGPNAERRTPSTDRVTPSAERTAPNAAALDQRTREVAAELRCPVCQGESIQESPSELAQEMKAVVREQLAAGRSPDEVKAYFVARYGEWILLRPTTSGVNALLYVLPPLALLGGVVLVVLIARRWIRAPAGTSAPPALPDDA